MNKPIRTIAVFCLVLFMALMANTTYLQFLAADDLKENPGNRRVIEAAYSRERGAILVGRTPIAESVPSNDKYKFQRTYPQPQRYAHVTGYFSFFTQTGVESTQNSVLSGEDDRLFVTRLVDLVSNEGTQGASVQLTLDPDAQVAAYDGLRDAVGENGAGSVVAIDPSSGKILSLVSLPSYDPNKLASHDLEAVVEFNDRLNSKEENPLEPLVNRGIQKTLPPGSTFKLVTAAAAIESGEYDKDSKVPAGASYTPPQTSTSIENDGRSACSPDSIDFATAMENSCNTTFARLAVDQGPERMLEQAEAFGFNTNYLEGLTPQAQSVYPTDADAPSTAFSGIGQFDVRATPLQMAMVAGGIANGGVVKKPYIVDEVQSAELETIDKTGDEDLSRAVSNSTAEDLTDLMVSTVDNGTASPAAIDGVSVAGKTGTAQSGIEGESPYAWFVSFAPADDPQVAVAVVIEKTDAAEIAGGLLGGPIAREVMQAVIQ